MRYQLKNGFKSIYGQIEIINSDSLCYVIKNVYRAVPSVLTLSKALLEEFVDYFEKYPSNTADQARNDLAGRTVIDRYE